LSGRTERVGKKACRRCNFKAHRGFIFLLGWTERVGKSCAAAVIPRLAAALSLYQGGQNVLVKALPLPGFQGSQRLYLYIRADRTCW
jgi:hypothetical protein